MDIKQIFSEKNLKAFIQEMNAQKPDGFLVMNSLSRTEKNGKALDFLDDYERTIEKYFEKLTFGYSSLEREKTQLIFIKETYKIMEKELFLWKSYLSIRADIFLLYLNTEPEKIENAFLSKLDELSGIEDFDNMAFIGHNILDLNKKETRKEYAATYSSAIYQALIDVHYNKLGDHPIELLNDLLKALEEVEKYSESNPYFHHERLMIYRSLADAHNDLANKNIAIEHALEQFNHWEDIKDSQYHSQKAMTLFEQLQINKNFETKPIEAVLKKLHHAYLLDKNHHACEYFTIKYTLHSLKITNFADIQKLLSKYEQLYFELSIEKDELEIVQWVSEMKRALEWKKNQLPSKFITEEYDHMRSLMSRFIDYDSSNENCSKLANAFSLLSKETHDLNLQETYLNQSKKYYEQLLSTKSKSFYDVSNYVTVIKQLIKIKRALAANPHIENYIELILHELENLNNDSNDFSNTIFCAETYLFIFENSSSYKNNNLLDKAEAYYNGGKDLGNDHFTQPYYGLAKIAILRGDLLLSQKILKTCDEIFSNEYHAHEFKECLDDSVFSPLSSFIKSLHSSRQKTIKSLGL
ncbi:hypothetical protein [Aureibacter tunicatorum]|uniref:Uncharacterized protein n=1 Tax=Aureibacter tunicatorum TaxID=866807 RepID=A0AAE3XKU1_9BACT|nr:hypothetical protein [Aureibacter tunicatorum]MDR6238267.1 hypothetical protein [Aureibacter tunicatorum]BDD03300.1 hypothetical protein AUTU_07830 [Aureibacter tunicatorum]